VISAETPEELAQKLKIPLSGLEDTLRHIQDCHTASSVDPFGRDFTTHPVLNAPYKAIRVTGALFHTQGGLDVDERARVLDQNGIPLPNLLAAGGAARGVSGPDVSGYLSGNGLLTAVALGRIAGRQAGRMLEAGE